MRKIVFQMMTTLNGRLDDPMAWVHDVWDDQYRDIDRIYATYDTVLVGRTTYEEMAASWPGALQAVRNSSEEEGEAAQLWLDANPKDHASAWLTRRAANKLSDAHAEQPAGADRLCNAAISRCITQLLAVRSTHLHGVAVIEIVGLEHRFDRLTDLASAQNFLTRRPV